ncbi:cell cycle regulator [Spinach severe curly top virus]|uniref:Cell cycle regulator n=1 Tax=Spinach severe curly top virus TaxID=873160 RepID=E0YA59_9GEMI|nr:cell cycle regulator [Spinach severe curly top virus]ADM64622.2 cell cycle regulator [Spinach severe curly top virus]
MKYFNCFKTFHGQSSNQHTLESPQRDMQMEHHISTVSYNYPESPTSRTADFSTLLTPGGVPITILMSKQPRTPMQSTITSPKKVIIVNPDNTRSLAVQKPIKTTSTTTQLTQEVSKRLLR